MTRGTITKTREDNPPQPLHHNSPWSRREDSHPHHDADRQTGEPRPGAEPQERTYTLAPPEGHEEPCNFLAPAGEVILDSQRS